jgi:16S rRNA (cytosine1402-N4)-methyltransferase
MNPVHIPVMAREIADFLVSDKSAAYFDATLGLGGHSKYILSLLNERGRVVGVDKDSRAVDIARRYVPDKRLITFNTSYLNAREALDKAGIDFVGGALFDLGLSSYQLDDASRGFGFQNEGPLDMRFDLNEKVTAETIVNCQPLAKLEEILRVYGDEHAAEKIARAIILARRNGQIKTTARLARIIESVHPRRGKTHPATKTFQALRIAVNDELASVQAAAKILDGVIKCGGRAAFLTFHSAEDKIIKNAFKEMAASGKWKLVNSKVLTPSFEEVKANPRSRSAKLRVIEKL